MRKLSKLSKTIARVSYILGSISLTLGIILSFVHTPASAAPGVPSELNQFSVNQPLSCPADDECDQEEGEFCAKIDGTEGVNYYDYVQPDGNPICMIAIKAGTLGHVQFYINGCKDPGYCVGGITTDSGWAERNCSGSDCPGISHVDFWWYDVNPPTKTPTPTSTKTSTATPTETNTPTPTETNTPTPTDTNTPTPTDTNTPTPTDTNTPTPTDTSEPSQTPTGTVVTPTDTPPVDTVTPTPTSLGTVITPTTTQPVADTPTPTATDPGTEVTPTDTTQPTLPPPQITGTPPSFLIPVTGVDLSSPFAQVANLQLKLVNLGLALLGLGLIFQGIGKKIEVNA